jgi:Leucine-rich repeat (LRR) protein
MELHAFASSMTSLNLSYNKLTTVPASLGDFTSLVSLDVRGNQMASLPDTLRSLAKLQDVALSFNVFTDIPACIYSLPRITTVCATLFNCMFVHYLFLCIVLLMMGEIVVIVL